MYICKIIKTDVETGKETLVKEELSRSGITLKQRSKKWAKDTCHKKLLKSDPDSPGYEKKVTPFVEVTGFKTNSKSYCPEHNFYHGCATVFNCYGKPIWILTIQIYSIDLIRD
jgi:hypothetical protein